jgi:ABC-type branched-subunit amino acid transport system substrate-binding protein
LKSKLISFNDEAQMKYGNLPGTIATFTFDVMNLLVEAIKKAGLERENIQNAFSEIHYRGVTDLNQFDKKWNRIRTIEFVNIGRVPI